MASAEPNGRAAVEDGVVEKARADDQDLHQQRPNVQRSQSSTTDVHKLSAPFGDGIKTPASASSAAPTPASEVSEEYGGIVDSKTTVTTEVVRASAKRLQADVAGQQGADGAQPVETEEQRIKRESFTLTHQGARGVSHTVEKDGSVHLRPKGRRKIRTLVSFRPRESHFDRHNREIARDPFRGFYTLFWISLAILMLNTFYNSYGKTGSIISLSFWTLFSRDAIVLALSDGALVASLFICVPFAQVLARGWFRYWPTLIWLQHTWQACLLASVIRWSHYRDWPWVQSGFFVLHTLSMMMKIHSYMAVNGYMADGFHRMKRLEHMIEERVAEIEGVRDNEKAIGKSGVTEEAWERAVEKAKAAGADDKSREAVESGMQISQEGVKIKDTSGQNSRKPSEAAAAKADVDGERSWDSLSGQRGTSVLRQRQSTTIIEKRAVPPSRSEQQKKKEVSHDAKGKEEKPKENGSTIHQFVIRDPHPLATHPDNIISDLAREVEHIREELTSSAPTDDPLYHAPDTVVYIKTVTWPDNVSYANFWDYLLVPTLVYELSYPRIKVRRPLYLLEKALATFGTFFVIYVITEHWIMPRQPGPDTPLIHSFLELAVPMMLNYLLIFYIMFECICQFFAEWTMFADRLFYEDWWNATSMDVFSRKWNRPVHSFLLRHVYASSITAGVPKAGAIFVTFLLSSLLHELVMAIVSGKIRGYLFAMQMAQIPLIAVGQIPFVRKNETIGNMIFWTGLIIGFPMLNIAYITY